MKIVVTKDYESLSEIAAAMVLEKMMLPQRVNLSLTAGVTPLGMYKILIERRKALRMDQSNIHYYNFDEVPLPKAESNFTMGDLNQAFYNHTDIDRANIHPLPVDGIQDYERELMMNGGIDLMVLGVGADGHFCANMPGFTSFDKGIFEIPIAPGHKLYEQLLTLTPELPGEKIVTFGPRAVLKSKQLVVFASGAGKAEIMQKVMSGPITEDIPASILRTHPNVTFILDEAAAALIDDVNII